jgi:hypothetical protein
VSVQVTEREQVDAAYATLQRVREMRVRFTARWTRFDDLSPEDEKSLKDALQAIWDLWAAEHGVTDGEVQGPVVITNKLEYIPYMGGELPAQ